MHIVSLFDHSGFALFPWAQAGYECYAYDLQNVNETRDGVHFRCVDLNHVTSLRRIVARHRNRVWLVSAFPPCTDLSASGAPSWARKLAIDPKCQRLSLIHI